MVRAVILGVCILAKFALSCFNPDLTGQILKEPFKLKDPIFVVSKQCWSKADKIRFAKVSIEKRLRSFKIVDDVEGLSQKGIQSPSPIVIIVPDGNIINSTLVAIDHARRSERVIIALPGNFNESFGHHVKINQETYFLHNETLEMIEAYSINGVLVKTKIGHYEKINGTLKFQQSVRSLAIVDRRSNFHGQLIVGMTTDFVGLLTLRDGYKTGAVFHASNETYDVTDWAEGLYFDILQTTAGHLNFTYKLYRRKDDVWGNVINNKTTGMLSNVVDGSADIIVQAFKINLARTSYLDYVPFITIDYASIFIKREQTEEIDWMTFFQPFRWDLWLGISAVSIVMGTWLFLGNKDRSVKLSATSLSITDKESPCLLFV